MKVMMILQMMGVMILLAACGNMQERDALAQQLLARLTSPQQAPTVMDVATLKASLTPEVLAQIDGPVLIAEVPDRDAVSALTRVGTNGGVETFLTPDGISVSMRNGVIVATRGLGFDLMTADVSEPLVALRGGGQSAVRIHRYLDGENQIFMRNFVCAYTQQSNRQVTENCKSSSLSFSNTYVLGAGGRILRSSQWISPQVGSILRASTRWLWPIYPS